MSRLAVAVVMAAALCAPAAYADDFLAVSWNEGSGGRVNLMETVDPWAFVESEITTDADVTLRYAGGKLYAVSRTASTVKIIDVGTWTVDDTWTLTGADDLRDIAVVSSSLAFLTEVGSNDLIKLNLSTGSWSRVADTSALSGDCGTGPELYRMAVYKSLLYIQLGGGTPAYNAVGCLGVVDWTTETVVDTQPLTIPVDPVVLDGKRPNAGFQTKMRILPLNPALPESPDNVDRLYVEAQGAWYDTGGGLEAIDAEAMTTMGLVHGQAGSIFRGFVLIAPDRGFISDGTPTGISSHLFGFRGRFDNNLQYDFQNYVSPWLEMASGHLFFPDGGDHDSGVTMFEIDPLADPPDAEFVTTTLTDDDPTDIELVPGS